MRWFVRGDVDGFFGLALDNLIQLLLVVSLCRFVLGFDDELLFGRVLPGAAVSLLVGNLFYAWQARQLARRTGRDDVCALPYGINTVSLIAYVFFVMLPAKRIAIDAGASPEQSAQIAWQAGLVACLGCGLIELAGSFVAERIRRAAPRAALLSTLAGIALCFIAGGFLFRTFAHPVVGLATLGIVLLVYFGRVRFRAGVPGGFVAVALGTLLAWSTGLAGPLPERLDVQFRPPVPVVGDLLAALRGPYFFAYLSVIVPMGLFNLIGSLQNIESAEAAGDRFPTTPSLAVNGLGSVAAALFGSAFPTTIYIGHPGWKAMGARAGYSILNAGFFTVVCLTSLLSPIAALVPIDAGMAIVLWIGLVIAAQAFQATPTAHAPAVVVGLLPGVAAWGALLMKTALRAGDVPFHEAKLVPAFQLADTWVEGAFALEQGFIFTSMILSALTVALIERRFVVAATWCGLAVVLSATGLMHGYGWHAGPPGDTFNRLTLGWSDWATGYAIMGGCFLLARWVTVPSEGHD